MNITFRNTYAALLCCALFALGFSLFLQYVIGLTPCPLCLLSRFMMFFLVLLFGLAVFHNPGKRGKVVYSLSALGCAGIGMLLNIRHLWILQLPPEKVPACTPGLDYLVQTLPIVEAILVVLNGSGECAQQEGMFLGLSLPGWTLLVFILLAVGALLPFIRQKKG